MGNIAWRGVARLIEPERYTQVEYWATPTSATDLTGAVTNLPAGPSVLEQTNPNNHYWQYSRCNNDRERTYSWVVLEREWPRLEAVLVRSYGPEAMVPRNVNEWSDLCLAVLDAKESDEAKKRTAACEEQELTALATRAALQHQAAFLAGVAAGPGHRSTVLSQQTVWVPAPPSPSRLGPATWPSGSEAKYEGDDRVASGYGRQLPLLRDHDPENSTVRHDLLPRREMLSFDAVGVLPWLADDKETHERYMEDEHDREHLAGYLSAGLLKALDYED